MEQTRNNVAAAAARVNELAARIPLPVSSVADAIMSLTAEERNALWASRNEAMDLVAQHRADLLSQLAHLTAQSRELTTGLHDVPAQQDFERLSEIAQWFEAHDEEVGLLKTMIRELDVLYTELKANPVVPTTGPSIAR